MKRIEQAEQELRKVIAELVLIRDVILRPQMHSTGRGATDAPRAREEDRQAYAETLVEFAAWCAERNVSFPLTLKRLAEIVMGRIDVEPKGELSPAIDTVAGVIRNRIDDGGRDVA